MDIERAKELLKDRDVMWNNPENDVLEAVSKVLSELEKKDKIIDEMSNSINLMSNELVAETGDNNLEFCKMQKCIDDGNLDCADCIKQYFTNKVEKEGSSMEIKTKYEIGDRIWFTYEDRGEVHVFDDIIREINITSNGTIEYWCDEAGDAIKETDVVRYEDATGLSNRIKELLQKFKEKQVD